MSSITSTCFGYKYPFFMVTEVLSFSKETPRMSSYSFFVMVVGSTATMPRDVVVVLAVVKVDDNIGKALTAPFRQVADSTDTQKRKRVHMVMDERPETTRMKRKSNEPSWKIWRFISMDRSIDWEHEQQWTKFMRRCSVPLDGDVMVMVGDCVAWILEELPPITCVRRKNNDAPNNRSAVRMLNYMPLHRNSTEYI